MANPAVPRLSPLRSARLLPSCSPFHHSKSFVPRGRNRGFSCCSELLLPIKSEFCLSFGAHLIPHPAKAERGGEDAFFVNSYNGGVLAVADGVSGWAAQDVNPALFSRELMAKAEDLLTDEEVNYDPQVLMKMAHSATSSVGSATVIIAMLEKNGILRVANVGDCGLRLIRKEQINFATSPRTFF